LAVHSGSIAEDDFRPTYDKAELQKALTAERAAVEAAEQREPDLEDSDKVVAARQDLAVRKRFVAALEACAANGHACPPRLDDPAWTFDIEKDADPQLEATLRFDVASWQKIAAELHGRACACRTWACTESVGVAIERLEQRPMPDVVNDETAVTSIVRARDCLFRLRGKKQTPRATD
jgi:hypothetical protein